MKAKLTLVLLGLALLPVSGFAEKEVGNGGDICEDQFKIVRDDIASWINKGGSSALSLQSGISLNRYNTEMLAQISKAQISCTQDKVLIGGAEKTCKNFIDPSGVSRIVCNIDRLTKQTSESEQYVLVHHEYAGLAGFEVNDGESSQYPISNQITQYLTDTVVKRLAVKEQSSPTMYERLSASYNAGTLPDLNVYFHKVGVGRCFGIKNPNSPIPMIFSVKRNSIPDSGPLNPGPRFQYFAYFVTSEDQSIDTSNYEQIKGSSRFITVTQVDERTYAAAYGVTISQSFTLSVRKSGEYLVGELAYSSFFGGDEKYFCYFYHVND